jgi:predicted small metal-binding protein
MTKVLRCNDLMPGCSYEARGNSEEEVLAQASEHAKTVHNLTEIPEGMLSQVMAAIHDDEQAGAQTASA